MRIRWVPLAALLFVVGGLTVSTALKAQVRSNDANVTMMDDCSPADGGYNGFGGCPEEAPFPGSNSFTGDVTVAEFFQLLVTPLAPAGHIIGHPSWRNEPSYISIDAGQRVRVTNRGGRGHTFTKVAEYGGGFVPPLNGALEQAEQCDPTQVVLLLYGEAQTLQDLEPGQLHKFQCCIHPWMRAAVRVK
jgi:plastocyanin